MASTYLTRTPSGSGNKTKFTFSVWIKKQYQATGSNKRILSSYFSNGGRHAFLAFGTDEQLYAFSGNYTSGATTTDSYRLNSSRKFRDTNAWYHIVYRVDTTQATASDRIRCYINGELLEWDTSHPDHLYPNQNDENYINSDYPFQINALNGIDIMDCVMSHINFCDGQSYDATAFGEYDANGVWKIKTSPSVTYGTNGFFILKDGNSVTDQSPNTNNFTVGGGTLTKTEDNPSNVFATLNPLLPNAETFSNGNTTYTNGSGANWRISGTTLAPTSGKYYCEVKITENGGGTLVGLMDMNNLPSSLATDIGSGNWSWSYDSASGNKRHDGSNTSYGDTFTTSDIMGIAMDLDNLKLYFSKNGTWQNSGVPTSGATGTGSAFDLDSGASYAFAISSNDAGTNPVQDCNFGNGYFGTTAVSSAGTNASGIGIFEYDVPTGYTALSTKGLNL